MDGAGVPEAGRLAHIANGQPDGQLAAGVPDREVTAPADTGYGPAVPVFDPVGGSESESAVVAAGDDHISNTRLIAIGQTHLAGRRRVVETMRPGSAVEFGNKLAAGGEHHRVEPRRSIGNPSREGILGGLGNVADMDAAVIEIEGERRRIAFPKYE